MARRVDEVDREVADEERGDRRPDRDAAFALELERVGLGGSGVDAADVIDGACGVEQALAEGVRALGTSTGWITSTGQAFLWTILWIILAALCWTGIGALTGFVLGRVGRGGGLLLGRLGTFVAVVFRLCGMKRMAGYFALQ